MRGLGLLQPWLLCVCVRWDIKSTLRYTVFTAEGRARGAAAAASKGHSSPSGAARGAPVWDNITETASAKGTPSPFTGGCANAGGSLHSSPGDSASQSGEPVTDGFYSRRLSRCPRASLGPSPTQPEQAAVGTPTRRYAQASFRNSS